MADYFMGNFTTDCPNGSYFVWKVLKECTENGRDTTSVVLGLFSVFCFMMAAFPQCYSSYLNGNMDQAVSIWFLIGWLAGDSCNALGAFLAQQLPIQIYTAVYYVVVDVIMVSLYIYYAIKNRSRPDGTVINAVVAFVMLGAMVSLLPGKHLGSSVQDVPKFTRRSLLAFSHVSANQEFTTQEIIGFTIGSFSSVFYLASRLPQLCRNSKRKSTEGISPLLFSLMILGNLTYGLSVLLKDPRQGQSKGNYVVHHLPWLIGSLGTMGFDMIILFQFFIYQEREFEERRPLI
ncbi:lysosomal amino acid transporter 1 homolog [Rhincodon typus]|uniref:lysosomal amino acid transporter 1 homolog n=1 Tax=Rhincodon typus TaxID=259920 RepID=UPI0009A44DC8|nr:lysosomal amino acid transporter 1 homolog [Rhincodon typus]XP_048470969.1 lysosomal amino acid transporter 1 homolog [Rhincodon typus]